MFADARQAFENIRDAVLIDFDHGHRSFAHGLREREDALAGRDLFPKKGPHVLRS